MKIIKARNVNDAYAQGLAYLLAEGREEATRAGPCLVAPGPVTTLYERPTERVLFAARRDANCFFHLCESLAMLAGRNDAALLDRYVRDFGARFAEPNGNIHDGYGRRWRVAFGFDQLEFIIAKFKREPGTRQLVLSMWDPRGEAIDSGGIDWTCGEDDLRDEVVKTRPCNTHAYFRISREKELIDVNMGVRDYVHVNYLDMMVCCRSNDILYGCYGANSCHFSVLQEYLAAMIGVHVGVYHQVSFNYHAYHDVLTKVGAPELDDRYTTQGLHPVSLVDHPQSFDSELSALLTMVDHDQWDEAPRQWRNDFLGGTALPLLRAHSRWRAGRREQAYEGMEQVWAPDWRAAGREWMERRLRRGVQS